METKKYEYIDVLRGLAIILVVECHTARLVPHQTPFLALLSDLGSLGVQLFFVASALTLCLSMRGRGASPRGIAAFYLRRFFRIAPLYYVGIAVYGALSAFYAASGNAQRYHGEYSAPNVMANLFLAHGIYAPANNNIVPGGWSIGCEVLFYALFPYLFLRVQTEAKCRRFIVIAFVLNLLVQWAFASQLEAPVNVSRYPFLFYFFLNQLPVFGIGMLLYFRLQGDSSTSPQSPLLLAQSLCFLVATGLVFHFSDQIWLGYAGIPTLAALAFFFLALGISTQSHQNFLSRLLAEVGRKSYSIYIFHFLFAWDILGTTSFWLQFRGLQSPAIAWPFLVIFNLALSYIIALFSGRFIEENGIAMGRRLIRGWKLSG